MSFRGWARWADIYVCSFYLSKPWSLSVGSSEVLFYFYTSPYIFSDLTSIYYVFFFFIFSKLLNYQRKLRIYQEQFYWKKLGLFHQLPTFHSLPYFSRTRINPLQCFPFRFFEKDFSTYHSFNLYSVQVRLSLIPLTFVRAYAIFEEQNLVMVCYFLSSL